MRCAYAVPAALLFALTGSPPVGAEEVETVGHFLFSMPASTLDPAFAYCAEQVPEVKEELLKEKAGFIEKLTEAGRPLLERLSSDPEFNMPVPESMREEIAKANSQALSMFKQQDPGTTCRRALERIRNATVDELRKVVEDTYRNYRDAGQARKSG